MLTRSATKRQRVADSTPQPDRVDALPHDLVLSVFQFLDARSHVRLGWQSKALYATSKQPLSWCWRQRVLEAIGIYSVTKSLDWTKARQEIEAIDPPTAESLYCHGRLLMQTIGREFADGAYVYRQALALFKQAADLGHWWARYFYAERLQHSLLEEDQKVRIELQDVLLPELVGRAIEGDAEARQEVREWRTMYWPSTRGPRPQQLINAPRFSRSCVAALAEPADSPGSIADRAELRLYRLRLPSEVQQCIGDAKTAADAGFLPAWYTLGRAHWHSDSGEDKALASDYIKKAAAAGHHAALYWLSSNLDPAGRVTWSYIKEAADLLMPAAIREMHQACLDGTHAFPADPEAAAKYKEMLRKMGYEDGVSDSESSEDEDEDE